MKNTLILGNSGMGKTTLMKDTSDKVLKQNKNAQVITLDWTGEFYDWSKKYGQKPVTCYNVTKLKTKYPIKLGTSIIIFNIQNFRTDLAKTRNDQMVNSYLHKLIFVLRAIQDRELTNPKTRILINLPEMEFLFSRRFAKNKFYQKVMKLLSALIFTYDPNSHSVVGGLPSMSLVLNTKGLNNINKYVNDPYNFNVIDTLMGFDKVKAFQGSAKSLKVLDKVLQLVPKYADLAPVAKNNTGMKLTPNLLKAVDELKPFQYKNIKINTQITIA